jgi:hypothetical protein
MAEKTELTRPFRTRSKMVAIAEMVTEMVTVAAR